MDKKFPNSEFFSATLGEKIKKARKDRGMTQSELCGEHITRNMLSRIENGQANPSLETLYYIASALDISPGYLVDDNVDVEPFRDIRLKKIIKSDYLAQDYASALEYSQCFEQPDDEIRLLISSCSYKLGLECFYDKKLLDARAKFREAYTYAQGRVSSLEYISDCKMYDALIGAFIKSNESGEEEKVHFSSLEFSGCRSDVVLVSRVAYLLRKCGAEAAEELNSVTHYSEKKHALFSLGLLACEKEEYALAIKYLSESVDAGLLPTLECWALSLLEKASVELGSFKKAYMYSNIRKTLVKECING